jgi:CubicO group peptidase (beta-lactamase class C family)
MPKPEKIIDAMFTQILTANSPGAAVLVAQNGKVIFEKGYGLANIGDRVPVTPQTKFRIGSITKQFTAAAILRLHEQGKLGLDAAAGAGVAWGSLPRCRCCASQASFQ